ncbi:hypothetical protein C8J56DRAFT_1046749 [Mycena floridula]|nr:hypothetical protein C8J56DRAFT_1046749 [Mycena floridula]
MSSCRKYNLYRQLLLVAAQLFVSFLLTLRIYALFNRDRRILWGTSGTAAVLFIAVCWPLFGQKSSTAPVPGIGCHIALSRDSAIRLAAAWEALFAYDTLLFCLTLCKTYTRRYYDDSGIRIRVSAPLVSLVLRDGAIYFAVMALSTLANVMTFYFAGPFLRGGLSTFASGDYDVPTYVEPSPNSLGRHIDNTITTTSSVTCNKWQ